MSMRMTDPDMIDHSFMPQMIKEVEHLRCTLFTSEPKIDTTLQFIPALFNFFSHNNFVTLKLYFFKSQNDPVPKSSVQNAESHLAFIDSWNR